MKISIVIVTYNPDINKICDFVDKISNFNIIIVDNFSENRSILSEKIKGKENCLLLLLDDNNGIAYAQNKGIKSALKSGAEFICFFDQDSTIDSNFLKKLYEDFLDISLKDKSIAAIGPRFIDEKQGFYFPALIFNKIGLIKKIKVSNIDKPIQVSCLISSGTLISVSSLKEIGYMKENFFIDYVDTEWCFRALSKGYKIYMSSSAVMKHSIGDDTIRFLNFKIPVHSGFRRYFRIRNLFFMWQMPYIPKILTFKLMVTNFLQQILLAILKKDKISYIKFYLKAVKDGIIQSKKYDG